MRSPLHSPSWGLLLLGLAPLPGQGSLPTPPADLVRRLELDSERGAATNALLRLGSGAVTALTLALDDPRAEIQTRAMVILGHLGPCAVDALPRLETLARGEPALATPAAWAAARARVRGITLIADYGGTLHELDAQGKVVHTLRGLTWIYDAELLANGNYLVARDTFGVHELTRAGDAVWSFAEAAAYDADRLPNGNTLIADLSKSRVIEVDAKGDVVWQIADVQPVDADRLADGNTLITDNAQGRILEVSPQGEIVWTLAGLEKPVDDADRLPSGNTLYCTNGSGAVREVDPTGALVMEVRGLDRPNDADRLPNGHTLVACYGAVLELDTKGKEVWRFPVPLAGEVNRY